MGLAGRLKRAWAALTGGDSSDPQQVIESAMAEFRERYRANRDLVASVLRQRDQLRSMVSKKEQELKQVHQRAREAARSDRDDLAISLLEQEKLLEAGLEAYREQLGALEQEAARGREAMLLINAEVERLERDRLQASRLATSDTANTELRKLTADLKEFTADPALDRARSEIERDSLARRYARELDQQDQQQQESPLISEAMQERLKALKEEP